MTAVAIQSVPQKVFLMAGIIQAGAILGWTNMSKNGYSHTAYMMMNVLTQMALKCAMPLGLIAFISTLLFYLAFAHCKICTPTFLFPLNHHDLL